MENNKRQVYEKVKKQLNDASGFLVYAMGNWDKDGFSVKNDSANTFFKLAIENIKSVVNNTEYDSYWFNADELNNCEKELNKFSLTDGFYEVKKLIANGLRYGIEKEIEYINKNI